MRLDRWRQDIERLHSLVVAAHVVLHHFHGLELLKACFLGNLVLAFVGVVLKVAYIGDIAHIAHLVAKVGEISVNDIECDGRTGMSEMAVAINCRPADIHAHHVIMKRMEFLFPAGHGVVDGKHSLALLIDFTIGW